MRINGIHTLSGRDDDYWLDTEKRRLKVAKHRFVDSYQANEFGNRAPTWDTFEDFLRSGYTGLIHIRNRVAGGDTWYDVPAIEVPQRLASIVEHGLASYNSVYFSGMAPTDKTVLQGEVRRSENHLDLFYSTIRKPMRESLAKGGQHVSGIIAVLLLKEVMDPPSYDWFETLLDRYPDHVIEFSTYAVNWGTICGRNTVWWEVRLY